MYKKYVFLAAISMVLCLSSALALVELERCGTSLQLKTLYGETAITEPVLIELITSAPFERLRFIHQYGMVPYVRIEPQFTRYEHSLGVFFLTRAFGAPLAEQIAALLHDVSHTAFSHVADRLFKSEHLSNKASYQDTIHEWYLHEVGIDALLQRFGYDACCGAAAKKKQRCFEQSLPDLCADRIEYNLAGAYIDRLITVDEIAALLRSLQFNDGEWFFDDIVWARKFGYISLILSETRWGSKAGVYIDYYGAQLLSCAHELGLITMHDVHFSYDDALWRILSESPDSAIVRALECLKSYAFSCQLVSSPENTIHLRGKFSGTDPLIVTAQGLCRLTELDMNYKREFERVQKIVCDGWDFQNG